MGRAILVALLVGGCSNHPPDIQAYQSIINPICIIKCEAYNAAQIAKGNNTYAQDARPSK